MQGREFHNLFAIGTISKISADGLSARVRIGETETDFRPLPANYGEHFTANIPTLKNSQVLLAAPSGNLENSVIVLVLWSSEIHPYTTQRHINGVKFKDGTTVEYDTEKKETRVIAAGKVIIDAADTVLIKSQKDIELIASGKVKISGSASEIAGPVTQTGGDITSDNISVQNHKHPETGSLTREPE